MGTERLHIVVPGSISCQFLDRVADAHIARRKNMVRPAGAQRLGQSFVGLVGMALEKPEEHDGATDDAEAVRLVQGWHMSCAGMGCSPHAEDPGAISTVLSKPASGGNGHSRRVAIVFGLADLFFDHESDTNYYCWLTDTEPASGGSGRAAFIGYSRFNDKPGRTHGWVSAGLWRQRG